MELLAAFSIDVENLMLSSNCCLVLVLTSAVLEDVAQEKAMHLSRAREQNGYICEGAPPAILYVDVPCGRDAFDEHGNK